MESSVAHVSICILTILVAGSLGENVEYICNNSSASGELQITMLLNDKYGRSCDQVNPRWSIGLMTEGLRQWATKQLHPVRIGFNLIDTCGRSGVAMKAISEAVPYSLYTADGNSNSVCTVDRQVTNLGIISELQPLSLDFASLLTDSNVPLLLTTDDHVKWSSSSHSALTTTGYSARTTIEMMLRFMVKLEWDFVTAVYSDDALGIESLKIFESLAPKYYICINKQVPVNYKSEAVYSETKGVVYLGSEGIGLYALSQVSSTDKVWLTALDVKGLQLRTVVVYSVRREVGDPMINALAILGEAVKKAHNLSKCNADNVQECASKQSYREEVLRTVKNLSRENRTYNIETDGTVSRLPNPVDPVYTANIYSKGGYTKVASISLTKDVTTTDSFVVQHSLCLTNTCREICAPLNDNEHLYIPGDWEIVVTLPIRKSADPNDRWSCKDFTKSGLFRTEAAYYAFSKLNKILPPLNGKRMGMLIIDSCGDKLKTAGVIYDILRGQRKICTRNDRCFDPTKIVAFIGDYSSAVTQQMQTILREKKIIQMAYGASSVALNDREIFPYFLRTNPPDDIQAHFMVELLKKIDKRPGNKVNAVNIVYSIGLYGRTGAQKVKESLEAAKICVHLERVVNETGNNFTRLAADLIHKSGNVRFIVLFLDPVHLRGLMDTIKTPEYRTSWKSKGFSFILSDTWNDDQELLNDYGILIKGSFSFKFNSDFEAKGFSQHLKSRSLPAINDVNPWLSTLVQERAQCKIRGNFHSPYTTVCNELPDLEKFVGESYSLHLMKAITAMFYGLRTLVFDNSHSILFNPDSIDSRYEKLLHVKIANTLEGKSRYYQPFTQKIAGVPSYGNGKVGYTIYNIDGTTSYVQVQKTGSGIDDKLGDFTQIPEFFEGSGKLSSYIESVVDSCFNEEKATTKRPGNGPNALVVGMAVMAVILLIIIVAVAVYFILRYRRRRQKQANGTSSDLPMQRQAGSMPYDDMLTYTQYMSKEQRDMIQKFVVSQPGSAPPSDRFGPAEYPQEVDEPIYHIPQSNAELKKEGMVNEAFNDSTISATSRTTVGESVASGSTAEVVAAEIEVKSGADKKATNSWEYKQTTAQPPKPKPRSFVPSDDGSGTIGSNKSAVTMATNIITSEEHAV